MSKRKLYKKLKSRMRTIRAAETGDEELGPLSLLPGKWKSLPGHGWNMIALPFATAPTHGFNYRLLVNQYNEELEFSLVDKAVANRGIDPVADALESSRPDRTDTDQFLVTLDYEQTITQIAADDFPQSGKAGDKGLAIHHEPGLWLFMTNEVTNDLDIARLAAIPHGDSVLALGTSSEFEGAPTIPTVNGLPVGAEQDLETDYLLPYKHFHDNPFQGVFDPVSPNDLLKATNKNVSIVRTTQLRVDTTVETGGIVNIPFIVKQANAVSMNAHFWIEELEDKDRDGNSKLRLQYSQVVMLDFHPRGDGLPGVIGWPHVSINTLERVATKYKKF